MSAVGAADAATFTGTDIKLDASATVDPEGDAVSYAWAVVTRPAGSAVAINSTTAVANFRADIAGTYVLSLRVTDSKGATSEKQATVLVSLNSAPVTSVAITASYSAISNTTATRIVTIGALVLLDGTGSHDADGDPVTTSWTLIDRPVGSAAQLVVDGKTARLATDVAGVYTVRARGTDPSGAYSETLYPVEAVGTVPQVMVVASMTNTPVSVGSTVVSGTTGYLMSLSGSASTNPDGGTLTYAWSLVSKPVGSATVLDGSTGKFTAMTPDLLGDYVVKLTTTASSGAASTFQTTVSVKNRRPIASIGSNATPVALPSGPTLRLPANTTVTLRGTSSFDADGDTLSYRWTLDSKPAGSTTSLSASNTNTVQMTTDLSGSYEVTLRVTDPSGAYSEQRLTIASGNTAPVATIDKERLSVIAGTAVAASAARSIDDDGDALSYSWAIDAKPANSVASTSSTSAVLSFTPDVPGTYIASVTVSDGKASSVAYVTIKALSTEATSFSLPFLPLMSRYSRGLDRLIVMSGAPDKLNIVDPFSGAIASIPLPGGARSINLSANGKLAVVLHESKVSLVDLDNATLLRTTDTTVKWGEAFVTDAGLVYLVNASYNGPGIGVIDGKTGIDRTGTLGKAASFFGNGSGVYSSIKHKAFTTSVGLSPSDIYYIALDAQGAVRELGDSPYHGTYPMTSPLFLNATEDLIFNSSGYYFRTDTLSYVGKLPNTLGFIALSHSATVEEIITLSLGSASDPFYNITVYSPTYRRFTGALFAAGADLGFPKIAGLQSYGINLFHSANDNHIAIVQTGSATANAAGLQYYVIRR